MGLLRHRTVKGAKRVFTIRMGGGPEVVVNADENGVLRAPAPRGEPLENGPALEEAFPQVVDSLLSLYRDQIEDGRPKPAPDEEPEPVPAPAPRRHPIHKPQKEAGTE